MEPLILVLSAFIFLSVAIILFAQKRPDYSHTRHTISELGEISSPQSQWVSFGVFLPVWLALAYTAFLVKVSVPHAALLAVCIGIGYLAAAVFPCDTGSPPQGSIRQGLHNLGGGIEYIGGCLAMWQIAESYSSVTIKGLAITVGIAAVLLSIPALFSMRGLIQRIAEAALFGCLAFSLIPSFTKI